MILTSSIRRKMSLLFALVAVMLIVLSVGIVSMYRSYKTAVDDFEFSVTRAPRRTDLAEPIGMLFQPMLEGFPQTLADAERQQAEFAVRLGAARAAFEDFVRKCEQLPGSPDAQSLAYVRGAFLARSAQHLRELDALVPLMVDPAKRRFAHPRIMQIVAKLQTEVHNLPDHVSGIEQRLTADKNDARWQFRFVIVCAAVVAATFVGLFFFGYRTIFTPVRDIHEGARRIAQGHFDYEIPVEGKDEFSDLAKALNAMTARFREIRDELDDEVHERSRQLVRSERLAGVGFLSAGVAHEINNPLSAISVAAESLVMRIHAMLAEPDSEDGRECREDLAMIHREAQRCGGITARLLDFARGQDDARGPHCLATIVDEVVTMVRPMKKFAERNIVVHPCESCVAEVHAGEIKQVVLNLVANALEAMDAGGTLEITLEPCPDRIAITFRDEGVGMTPEVLEHLFEPFFTRRRGGRGTGLGLAITNRIVEDHGGRIEASSEGEGQGSTFRVLLPRRQAGQQAA